MLQRGGLAVDHLPKHSPIHVSIQPVIPAATVTSVWRKSAAAELRGRRGGKLGGGEPGGA